MEQVLILEDEENGQTVPKVCAFFSDFEMDVFMVEYGYDDQITLHAEGVTHIATGPEQLEKIASLSSEAQSLMEELDSFIKDEQWVGHEHLITKPKISNLGPKE